MINYDYVQAKNDFDSILNTALKEDVIITKSGGIAFKLAVVNRAGGKSPFDIEGLHTDITTAEILDVLRECRES